MWLFLFLKQVDQLKGRKVLGKYPDNLTDEGPITLWRGETNWSSIRHTACSRHNVSFSDWLSIYRSCVDPILDPKTKLAVLINDSAASAAEIVSGAVQYLDAGVIDGGSVMLSLLATQWKMRTEGFVYDANWMMNTSSNYRIRSYMDSTLSLYEYEYSYAST